MDVSGYYLERSQVSCTSVILVLIFRGALSDGDILQAERSLYRVRHDLVAKREEMSRLNATEQASGGWMGKVFGSKADQGRLRGLGNADE